MKLKRFLPILILAWVPGAWAIEPVSVATSTNAADPNGVPNNLPPRLREKCDKMPPAMRQEFLRRWQQWQKLPPEVRARAQKNYQHFRKMTPEQRAKVRKNFERLQNMSPEAKKKFFENLQRWEQLSPQERERLRAQMGDPQWLQRAQQEIIILLRDDYAALMNVLNALADVAQTAPV
ncbi:MAG: DUF3106 domain-containing protein, partial [Verrucomicrobiae bacterium]|nr:DUF3106 domain-containing protein [Verrucomicrobiae bacterium]